MHQSVRVARSRGGRERKRKNNVRSKPSNTRLREPLLRPWECERARVSVFEIHCTIEIYTHHRIQKHRQTRIHQRVGYRRARPNPFVSALDSTDSSRLTSPSLLPPRKKCSPSSPFFLKAQTHQAAKPPTTYVSPPQQTNPTPS